MEKIILTESLELLFKTMSEALKGLKKQINILNLKLEKLENDK